MCSNFFKDIVYHHLLLGGGGGLNFLKINLGKEVLGENFPRERGWGNLIWEKIKFF